MAMTTIQFAYHGVLILALLVSGCEDARDRAWKQASRENTEVAYREFQQKFPADPRSQKAQARIASVTDDADWKAAEQANTRAAYAHYLVQHAQGHHMTEALQRANEAEENSNAPATTGIGAPNSPREFTKQSAPEANAEQERPQPTKATPSRIAGNTNYRVQLGAFRQRSDAREVQRKLQGQVPALIRQIEISPSNTQNSYFRVHSNAMTIADAREVCAQLKASHQPCTIVKR